MQPGRRTCGSSKFKDLEPGVKHKLVGEKVFPFLGQFGGDGTYSDFMAFSYLELLAGEHHHRNTKADHG